MSWQPPPPPPPPPLPSNRRPLGAPTSTMGPLPPTTTNPPRMGMVTPPPQLQPHGFRPPPPQPPRGFQPPPPLSSAPFSVSSNGPLRSAPSPPGPPPPGPPPPGPPSQMNRPLNNYGSRPPPPPLPTQSTPGPSRPPPSNNYGAPAGYAHQPPPATISTPHRLVPPPNFGAPPPRSTVYPPPPAAQTVGPPAHSTVPPSPGAPLAGYPPPGATISSTPLQQLHQYPPPAQHHPPQSSAPVPIIPKPDAPSNPHAPNGLEAYYPKAHFVHGDFGGGMIKVKPPVVGRAVILDDGNASPHLWASSMYAIPSDSTTLKHTGFSEIPLMVTPLALPSQEYIGTVGEADHLPESGRLGFIALDIEPPERCTHCLAYANALMVTSGTCNFCNSRTSTNRKNVGTVDYPVDGPYVTRPKPVQPHILWAIDLTAPNCLEYLRLLIQKVLPTWHHQQQQQQQTTTKTTTRAGILLVSARGVYLQIKGGGENSEHQPFVIMPDLTEEPFAPIPLSEYTFDLQSEWDQMQDSWQNLLGSVIPDMIQNVARDKLSSQQPLFQFSCGGAALGMMVDALQESGGRAVWVSWRRPNHGVGKLSDRQTMAKEEAYSSKEHTLYAPWGLDKFYQELATTAAKSQVVMDVVLMTDPTAPKSYMDIATLQQVCQTTNGRLTWIKSKVWQKAFIQTLIRPLQFTGCDAVLKVRVSNGLRVKSLESAVGTLRQAVSLTDDSPELELAVVTPDTSVGVYLQHRVGGLPKNSNFVYIQSALLYTNPWNGQRRVRVSTLALRVAPNAQHVFSSMEFNTLAASMMRQVVTKIRVAKDDNAIQEARQQITEQCVTILSNYRKYGASLSSQASGSNQLMLPDKLTLLPLFVISLLKSPLLRASISRRNTAPNPLADDRAYQLYYASQVSPAMALWTVFPLIVDLHSASLKRWQHPGRNLPEDAHGLDILKQAPYLALPDPIMPSMSELQDDQMYLMVTPLQFYIVIGKDVTKEGVQEILAVVGGKEPDEDTVGGNLARLLKQVKVWSQVGREPRWLRPIYETIELVSPQQVELWLVADTTPFHPDYVNFLQDIHQKVFAAYTK